MAYDLLPMVYGLCRETPPALERLGKGTTSGNSDGALALMAPWHSFVPGQGTGSDGALALMDCLGAHGLPWRSWPSDCR